MTSHIPIQAEDTFGAEDYVRMENLLLDRETPKAQLEEICMTLAHTPTAEAQELLGRFRNSARATEVTWLEPAIEEGQMHYLEPRNEQEEREFLALKVIEDIEDRILDLDMDLSRHRLRRDKAEIELEAIRSLIADGEFEEGADLPLVDAMRTHQARFDELDEEIETNEKIINRIRAAIQTEKYQQVSPLTMRHWHLDGEG